MELLLKLDGIPEELMILMLKKGYFKTKTELLRAGVMQLGKEYSLIRPPEELEALLVAEKVKKMDEDVRKGKARWIPLEEVERAHKAKHG